MISSLIHASGVACFGYALYLHPGNGPMAAHLATNHVYQAMQAYPGKWKYLTVWDVVLQFTYHSIGLLNDVAGSSETNPRRQTKLQKIRDALFASWAFPTGLFVSASFWGLYAIDRKLVFPKEVDVFFPSWLNHAVHTAPTVLLILELLTTPKILPSRRNSILGNLGFTGVYLSWVTWVYFQNGVWAYPVLNILNNAQRVAFFGFSFLSAVGFCYMGDKIARWRWGSSDDTKESLLAKPKAASPGKQGKDKKKKYY